jgi:hypothetical protein
MRGFMADCPNYPTCTFFSGKMENMPAVTNYLKKQFCHGYYAGCARFSVFTELGTGTVPQDLFPYESSRATEIISKARSQGEQK